MIDRSKFINGLIGKPWLEGAQGPEQFDCWGLARFVEAQLFGRDLPLAGISAEQVNDVREVMRAIQNHPARRQWFPAPVAVDGDLVTCAHHQYPSHVGVYLGIDRGGVLHTVKESGVCFDTIPTLATKGFARLRFYRFDANASA